MLPNACKTWKRVPGKVNSYLVPLDKNEIKAQQIAANGGGDDDEGGSTAPQTHQFMLQFQHTFNYASTETTFFAFSYPFSLDESTELIDKIEDKVTRPEYKDSIYFHREVLFYSLEGRKMEMFTISSNDGIDTEVMED